VQETIPSFLNGRLGGGWLDQSPRLLLHAAALSNKKAFIVVSFFFPQSILSWEGFDGK
jgi:hypothetical protein